MTSIPEKVFLLSLYEKSNGSIQTCKSPFLAYGLIASGLIQIVISRIGMLNSSKKIVIIDPIKEFLSEPADLLRQIQYEKEAKKSAFWIEALGRKRRRLEEEFFTKFVEKQIIVMDGQVFRFYPGSTPIPTLKFIEKEEIRQQILGGITLSLENFVVVKLMNSIHLLDQIFTYDEIKPIHRQIDNYKLLDLQQADGKQIEESIHTILDSLNQVIDNEKK